MAAIRVAVNGALGRMGQRLVDLLLCSHYADVIELVGVLDHPSSPLQSQPYPYLPQTTCSISSSKTSSFVLQSCLSLLPVKPDVLIDFSAAAGTLRLAKEAATLRVHLVIGTTGLSPEQDKELEDIWKQGKIGIIHAMNYSLGINLMEKLIRDAARGLCPGGKITNTSTDDSSKSTKTGDKFDIELIESHHNRKVDSPSGTALALLDALCLETGRAPRASPPLRFGRGGLGGTAAIPGARTPEEIGVHSIRMGGLVGQHEVLFGSPFEVISIKHEALNRDVFAVGAIKAALWLGRKDMPGKYSIQDVLFH